MEGLSRLGWRVRRSTALTLLALAALASVGASPVVAADPVTFGAASASSSFGKSIAFEQPVTIGTTPRRVELLVSTPGSIGPNVVPIPAGTASGSTTLRYSLDLADGHIVPNTRLTARWRVVDGAGRAWIGPAVEELYADDRFEWKTLDGSLVRVHWYEGNQQFGAKALKIGDDAVAATAKLLGVTESDPIDFFIYPDQAAFRVALGPGTRENVGGQAHPDIRTLFALIAPAEIDAGWIESVVPHELTHLVFDTAIDNPYHEPPHWLNEGLAVYLADGYDPSNREQVEDAVRDRSIMPLDGLAGAFPTTRDRFFLAYAESVSAVDRIVRVSGRDALVKLIRSYRDGVSDDEAFKAALGQDVATFEAEWLKEIGARPPTRHGPRPPLAGPLPAGWSGPRPNPSFEVVGSPAPGAPVPGEAAGSSGPVLALGLGALVLAVVVFAVGMRRMQRSTTRNAAGSASQLAPGSAPPVATALPRPPALTTADWSLPRDVDPPDETPVDDPPPAR